MFGAHLSIAGGLVKALDAAERLGMDCVQVFTRNQRRWSAPPIAPEALAAWWARLRALGWHRRRGRGRVVSHASYLVNLASPDAGLRLRSVALMRDELERCELLGIRTCVVHPGAHLGRPRVGVLPLDGRLTADERAGLRRLARCLDRLHRDLPGYRVITCLETTAGAGTTLGADFAQLAFVRGLVREPDRLGFCLDTCHVVAAGYDASTPRRAREMLGRFDAACGLGRLHAIHVNDSLGERGSRRDRHTHIGRGHCGIDCFRTVVNCRRLSGVPKILETPKGADDRGADLDLVNLRKLRRLVRRPRTGSR